METRTEAMGKVFHPQCFVCKKCGQTFSGSSFFEHESNAYHDTCRPTVSKVINPQSGSCASCRKAFDAAGKVVTAGNAKYHVSCFGCSVCNKQIEGTQYYTSKTGGMLCTACKSTVD